MERKKRLEIHLDAPLLEWLRKEAEKQGISLGELIRAALRDKMRKASR